MRGIHQRNPAKGVAVLAQSEGLIVSQDTAGSFIGRHDPDLADDRKLDLDHRSGCPQRFEPRGRVAEIVLVGVVGRDPGRYDDPRLSGGVQKMAGQFRE
jgi:hypothetical protein